MLLTTAEKGAIRAANTTALREQVQHIVPGVHRGGLQPRAHGAAASSAALCKQVQQ